MTDATPLASEQITPAQLVAFLNGEGPLEGLHFGDQHPSGRAFWWRKYLPALSATPAPSDQDASQAQGEVERLRVALEDVCNPLGYLQRMAEAEGNKLGGMAYTIANDISTVQRIARCALDASPAPGATAQDGVDFPCDGTCRICGSAPRSPTTGLCASCSDATPTPTIPAGMVAWHGGDSAPEDWDGGPVMFRNGTMQSGAGSSWSHPWADGVDGAPSFPHATTPFDIIAYTPLAAAPKQAEQQGVDLARLCERVFRAGHNEGWTGNQLRRDTAMLDADKGWSLYVSNGALAKSIEAAALNAPTGAVEKGEAK